MNYPHLVYQHVTALSVFPTRDGAAGEPTGILALNECSRIASRKSQTIAQHCENSFIDSGIRILPGHASIHYDASRICVADTVSSK